MKTKKELTSALMMYAVNLLARRRYSVSKLQQKLFEKCKKINKAEEPTSEEKEATEDVINFLIEKKYLNDTEYAELYVISELRRKPSGKFVIKHKLQQRGISNTIITSTLNTYTQQDEFEQAKEAIKKKLTTLRENDPQKRQIKLTRFLASRGFPFTVIQSAIKEVLNEEISDNME